MEFIGTMADAELGKVKIYDLNPESVEEWNSIKDDQEFETAYEEAIRIIGYQSPDSGIINKILLQMSQKEDCIYWGMIKAYLFGVVNGKRAERSRRGRIEL